MITGLRLFHGGVPGLRIGDLIEPRHARRRREHVYSTPNRLYARHYASLWGSGDLYAVEPIGEVQPSGEDSIKSFRSPAARVVQVLDRDVLLTLSERHRLDQEWTAADAMHPTKEDA